MSKQDLNDRLEVKLPTLQEALRMCKEVKKVNKGYAVVLHCMAPHFNKTMELGTKYQQDRQREVNGSLPFMVIQDSSDNYKEGDKVIISEHTNFMRTIIKEGLEMYEVKDIQDFSGIEDKLNYLKTVKPTKRRNRRYLVSVVMSHDLLYSVEDVQQ